MSKKLKVAQDFTNPDMIFKFSFCNLVAVYDPKIYSKKDITHLNKIIHNLGKEIYIDKSYVCSNDHKYEKTFMYEDGWNQLCKIIYNTDFSKKASKTSKDTMFEIFKMMILNYVYQCLDDCGYDIDGICVNIGEPHGFIMEVWLDNERAWRHYPGKWQTW